jgi:DNA invertase Pin-like site-specific DNA recombinase
MDHSFGLVSPEDAVPAPVRAVAYCRLSALDRQGRGMQAQQARVQAWASDHRVEIIHVFCDSSPAFGGSDDQPALAELINDWIVARDDFELVLCCDLTRVSRRADAIASLEAICRQHGKRIVAVDVA